MLVSEIATRVKRQFGDEAGAQITDADIIRWINDSQREIAVHNDLLQTLATTPVTVGDNEYTLPPDLLILRNVFIGSKALQAISYQDSIQYQVAEETTSSGVSELYWTFSSKITVFPKPASVGSLKIYYTRRPLDVTVVGDTPELPQQYHNRIVEYCLAQAYELDDNFDSYRAKMQVFTDGVDKLKSQHQEQPQDVYPSLSVSLNDTDGWDTGYY